MAPQPAVPVEAGQEQRHQPCYDDNHKADPKYGHESKYKCTAPKVGTPGLGGDTWWIHADQSFMAEDQVRAREKAQCSADASLATPGVTRPDRNPSRRLGPSPSWYSRICMPLVQSTEQRSRGTDTSMGYYTFPDPASYDPILPISGSTNKDCCFPRLGNPWGKVDEKNSTPAQQNRGQQAQRPTFDPPLTLPGAIEQWKQALWDPDQQYGYSPLPSAQPGMPGAFGPETSQGPEMSTSSPESRAATYDEIRQLREEVSRQEALSSHDDSSWAALRREIEDRKKAQAAKAAAAKEKELEDEEMAAVRLSRITLANDPTKRSRTKPKSAGKKEAMHAKFAAAGMTSEAEYLKPKAATSDKPAEDPLQSTVLRSHSSDLDRSDEPADKGPGSKPIKRRKPMGARLVEPWDGRVAAKAAAESAWEERNHRKLAEKLTQKLSEEAAKKSSEKSSEKLSEKSTEEGSEKPSEEPSQQPRATGFSRSWALARDRQQEARDAKEWVQVDGGEGFESVDKDEIMRDADDEMSGAGKLWQVVSKDGEEMADKSEWEMDMS